MCIVIVFLSKHWSTVQRCKWSPTANDPQPGNDPQIGPQLIPNRKWSPPENNEWHGFCFLGFFSLSIFFHQLKDKFDQIRKDTGNVNYNLNSILMTNRSHFFLDNPSETLWEKVKARKQKYHFSTTSIYHNNSLMLPWLRQLASILLGRDFYVK